MEGSGVAHLRNLNQGKCKIMRQICDSAQKALLTQASLVVQVLVGVVAYGVSFWFLFRRESLKGIIQLRGLLRRG